MWPRARLCGAFKPHGHSGQDTSERARAGRKDCAKLWKKRFLSYALLSYNKESVKLAFWQKREDCDPEEQMIEFYIIWKWRCFLPNQLSFNNPNDHYICARLQYKLVYIPTTTFEFNFPFNTQTICVVFSLHKISLFLLWGEKNPWKPQVFKGEKKQEAI